MRLSWIVEDGELDLYDPFPSPILMINFFMIILAFDILFLVLL